MTEYLTKREMQRLLGHLNFPLQFRRPLYSILDTVYAWVESLPERRPEEEEAVARGGDGVSPIIIGGNDWASAWALDDEYQPVAAVVPGGEYQREISVRFGVNVVMYALTGNYKTDQVHVQTLLDRLGEERKD